MTEQNELYLLVVGSLVFVVVLGLILREDYRRNDATMLSIREIFISILKKVKLYGK